MSELTYMLLKFGFLALMWVFVFGVVYALRSDLFGQRIRKVVARAREEQVSARSQSTRPQAGAVPAAAPLRSPAPEGPDLTESPGRVAKRLVITEGPKAGLEIELPDEELTIGRSGDSGLVIRDDFTSSRHARLLNWPNGWVIQDLDSTNGTFLDGVRVHTPTPVPLRTPITIGTSTFELRG
ncbi:MAG TPA: FHA domain-containing protein [Microbacteriaceae bacterium]|nr:FHA domain-containing protein [Microbacteriaceae bacterium]